MNLKTLQKFACTLKFDCVNVIILIQMIFKTLAGMHTNNQGSRMTQGTSRKGPPGQRRQQNDIPSHLSCHISYISYIICHISLENWDMPSHLLPIFQPQSRFQAATQAPGRRVLFKEKMSYV